MKVNTMGNSSNTRVWSKATNQAKFDKGDKVTLHLSEVNNDSPLVHGQTLTIKEPKSSGMPKVIKYTVEESDMIIPESRLRKIVSVDNVKEKSNNFSLFNPLGVQT